MGFKKIGISPSKWTCKAVHEWKKGKYPDTQGNLYNNRVWVIYNNDKDYELLWNEKDTDLITKPSFNVGDTFTNVGLVQKDDGNFMIHYKTSYNSLKILQDAEI